MCVCVCRQGVMSHRERGMSETLNLTLITCEVWVIAPVTIMSPGSVSFQCCSEDTVTEPRSHKLSSHRQ